MLAAAAVGLGIAAARSGLRYRPSPGTALVVLLLPYWAAIVFLVRWLHQGPERFWIGPFALAVPIMAWVLVRARCDGRVFRGLTCLLVGWVVWCSLYGQIKELRVRLQQPLVAAAADGPVTEAVQHPLTDLYRDQDRLYAADGPSHRSGAAAAPPAACVLLVGNQDASRLSARRAKGEATRTAS